MKTVTAYIAIDDTDGGWILGYECENENLYSWFGEEISTGSRSLDDWGHVKRWPVPMEAGVWKVELEPWSDRSYEGEYDSGWTVRSSEKVYALPEMKDPPEPTLEEQLKIEDSLELRDLLEETK